MASFSHHQSIKDYQDFNKAVYSLPDDRMFSIQDLVSHSERFTMRALKGIRKNNKNRLTLNLLIAFSFYMAVCNRLHLDIEEAIWRRFPMVCSYCGKKPCVCRKEKTIERIKISRVPSKRPNRMIDIQQMFNEIYPAETRTLADAGVHMAEEAGEVSEAMSVYLGEHKAQQFANLTDEIADWYSCAFGVANSAGIDVAGGLAKMFYDGCHVCHNTPCSCNFTAVSGYKS